MANREVYFRLGQRPEVSWTMEYIARPLCTIAVWTRTSSAARMNSVAIVSASRRFADLFARQRSRANLNAATHAVENLGGDEINNRDARPHQRTRTLLVFENGQTELPPRREIDWIGDAF